MTADDPEYERDRLYIVWRVVPHEGAFYVEENVGGNPYCRKWGPITDEATAREFARDLRRALINHVASRTEGGPNA